MSPNSINPPMTQEQIHQQWSQQQKIKLTPEAYIKAFGEDSDKSDDGVKMPKMSDLRNFDSDFVGCMFCCACMFRIVTTNRYNFEHSLIIPH